MLCWQERVSVFFARLPFLVVFLCAAVETNCLFTSFLQWWLNIWKVSRVFSSCLSQFYADSVICVLCDLLRNFETGATVKKKKNSSIIQDIHLIILMMYYNCYLHCYSAFIVLYFTPDPFI